jgi:hypothetical protein
MRFPGVLPKISASSAKGLFNPYFSSLADSSPYLPINFCIIQAYEKKINFKLLF